MHIMTDHESFTIYSSNTKGWPFIGFFPKLHNGWKSSKRIRHGLLYYEPAILVGRIYTDKSKWIRLGKYVWPYYLTFGYHRYNRENYARVV